MMEVLLLLVLIICLTDCCMTIQIQHQLKEIKKENTVNGEFERQIKNYRSIVRSQGKLIRLSEQKEVKKNEKHLQVIEQENRRIY